VAETLFNSIKQQYDEAVEQGRALSMRKVQIDKDIEFNKRQTSERQRLLAAYGEENRRRDWLEARIVEAESQLKALDEQTSLHQRLRRHVATMSCSTAPSRRIAWPSSAASHFPNRWSC
jgi:hypothetical protein